MTRQEKSIVGAIVSSTIRKWTGPTGGWLGSPAQVHAEIMDALIERFAGAPEESEEKP